MKAPRGGDAMSPGLQSHEYFIRAAWGSRLETPDEIAARFLRFIDELTKIDSLFALWTSGAKGPRKLETIRDRFAEHVAMNIARDDYNEPEPESGYSIGAYTRGQPDPLTFAVRVFAGSYLPIDIVQNDAVLETGSRSHPDPRAISYRLFKAAMVAMIEIWDPVESTALSYDLLNVIDRSGGRYFHETWMQYVQAPLAGLITPPASAIVERLSTGGLLMIATEETFDTNNPAHMAVARDIAKATAVLNALPFTGYKPPKDKVS